MVENSTIKTKTGKEIIIKNEIALGGQGRIYKGTLTSKKSTCIVKIFHNKNKNEQTRKRLEFLISKELEKESPFFIAPLDIIDTPDYLGYYCNEAIGETLETLLCKPETINLQEALILGLSICIGMEILNNKNIIYCDIHPGNFLINKIESIPYLSIIDFDNFYHTDVPEPSCIGQLLYIAPETRKAFLSKQPTKLSKETDYFSLTCLLHSIILFKHQASGRDDSEEKFNQAMQSGRWNHDPSYIDRVSNDIGGYPSEAMSPEICSLFRRGFSLIPHDRPTPKEWKQVLLKSLDEIFICQSCNGAFLINISQDRCPHCQYRFPLLKLVTTTSEVLINSAYVDIGRLNLGGDQTISSKHAVARRLGPETKMICTGLNPAFKWSGKKWVELPNNKEFIIHKDDKIRFGNIEINIKEA